MGQEGLGPTTLSSISLKFLPLLSHSSVLQIAPIYLNCAMAMREGHLQACWKKVRNLQLAASYQTTQAQVNIFKIIDCLAGSGRSDDTSLLLALSQLHPSNIYVNRPPLSPRLPCHGCLMMCSQTSERPSSNDGEAFFE